MKKLEDRHEIRNTKTENMRQGIKTANMKIMTERKVGRITETKKNGLRE